MDCPITMLPMTDPVMTPCGTSYERHAIEEWIRRNGNDPITKEPLSINRLRPNIALRTLIEQMQIAKFDNKNKDDDDGKVDVVQTSLQVSRDGDHVFIKSGDENQCTVPKHVIVVLDTSGSMQKDGCSDPDERDGLNRLDVVRHAANTLLHAAHKHGWIFSVIRFSDSASTVIRRKTLKTNEDVRVASAELDRLSTGGRTALWDGIQTGATLVQANEMTQMCTLTDGVANSHPPRGETKAMELMMNVHPNLTCHFFALGNNMNLKMLTSLASFGRGTFQYLADARSVGTVFSHTVAMIQSVIANNLQVRSSETNEWSNAGDLLGDGAIKVVGDVTAIKIADGEILWRSRDNNNIEYDHASNPSEQSCQDINLVQKELCKLTSNYTSRQDAISALRKLSQTVTYPSLLSDLDGELSQSIASDKFFAGWAKPYYASLASELDHQLCLSFFNESTQPFMSVKYAANVEAADELFKNLPPPQPSIEYEDAIPVQMSRYNDASGGCITPETRIWVQGDGGPDTVMRIELASLSAGDNVLTDPINTTFATVECVVNGQAKSSDIIHLALGVSLTNNHPIINVDGKWSFPGRDDYKRVQKSEATKANDQDDLVPVISVLLERDIHGIRPSTIWLGDHLPLVGAITLAHGIHDDPVASHDFLGSGAVVEALSKIDGFETYGQVTITSYVRDQGGNIVDIR
jgi:Mg-chelatase subunit ChlD